MSSYDSDNVKQAPQETRSVVSSDRSFNVAMVAIMILLVIGGGLIFISGSQKDADRQGADTTQSQTVSPDQK